MNSFIVDVSMDPFCKKNTPQKWQQKPAGAGCWRVCRVWPVSGVRDWMLEGAPKWWIVWIVDAIMLRCAETLVETRQSREGQETELSNLQAKLAELHEPRRLSLSLEGSLSLKVTAWKCTWKWMIGRKILSFWGPAHFQGLLLLVLGRVACFWTHWKPRNIEMWKQKTLGQGKLGQRTDWNTSSEELRPSNILFCFQILFQKGINREWMPCEVFALQHLTVSERGGWVWWVPWDTSSACLRL